MHKPWIDKNCACCVNTITLFVNYIYIYIYRERERETTSIRVLSFSGDAM